MKVLVLEAYRLFYYLTGAKTVSYVCAIILMSILYVILLMGLVLLLQDIFPLRMFAVLFKFPFNIATGVVIAGALYLTTSIKFVSITAPHGHGRLFRLGMVFLLCMLILAYNYLLRYL